MAKRVYRNYYSEGRFRHGKSGWKYEHGAHGTLFSEGRFPTKLLPADLPPWYVYGYCYHQYGFISAKGVRAMLYYPTNFTNHLFKDDSLYISYAQEIIKVEKDARTYVKGYDHVLHGWFIIDIIKAVDQYSEIDTSPIKRQINEKLVWYQEHWDVHREVPENMKAIFEDV
ncbi:MAG: hypothetical protein LUI10_07570 [Lachnospiraceae bacterium]|nr:hypothetical protein [Lachnospiraceae bacterium]